MRAQHHATGRCQALNAVYAHRGAGAKPSAPQNRALRLPIFMGATRALLAPAAALLTTRMKTIRSVANTEVTQKEEVNDR
jgi:hypothetical protein